MKRIACLALIGAFTVSCGAVTVGTPMPTGPTPVPTPSPSPTRPPTPSPSPSPSPPAVVSAECAAELEDFRDALDEMDGRLDVGLNYADYGERLGDISVALNRTDVEGVSEFGLACVEVALLLNEAFLAYIDAHDTWRDCFDRTGCSNDDIRSELQASWATASEKLDEARDRFP